MPSPTDHPPRQYARTQLYIRSQVAQARRDKKCERLVHRMFIALPHLQPADRPVMKSWAMLEILGDYVYAELRTNGVLNDQREARRLLDDLRKLKSVQLPYANALGLTPMARVQLKANQTNAPLDLPALYAQQSQSDETDAATPAAEPGSRPAPADGGKPVAFTDGDHD